ncbi:MAG: HutD family protein [Actinomycetota bacterium]|nr:HutD family protein [Actinomycetota bacterium]
MDIIRYADLKPARWLNGGGATRQLAASGSPEWDWRISIAEVDQAGPFSALPGIDRVITIIDGDLILLEVDGEEHPLERYRPYRFSGDSSASASLPTGNVMDLNVMTRRGAFRGFTAIIELSRKRPHPVFTGQHAVLLQGEAVAAEATPTAAAVKLGRFDAVVGSDAAPEVTGRGFLAIVSIDPAGA